MADARVALVTGATDGIGKETAIGLAKKGYTVAIVGRNSEKGARVVAEISEKTGNKDIVFFKADLSSQEEIRKLSKEVHARFSKIDVLVNNAGSMFKTRTVTVDGFETTFAFNHLAYFLLTNLLLDLVRAAGKGARIVNVASMVHSWGKVDFDDLQNEKSFSAMGAYSNSKLANVLFTMALARRLEGSGITVNCLHPGFVATKMNVSDSSGSFMRFLTNIFALSPEDGAKTSLYLALSPDVEGQTGGYYSKSKLSKPKALSQDKDIQEKLWSVSAKLCGIEAA